jgi:hypothetical protein
MNDPFVRGVPLDQKQADQLARFINLAFNSALLYGGGHQTTIDNCTPFFTNLSAMLEGREMLTLSVERESVFFEGWCIDKSVNHRRITGYFRKAGLQSVTFETGVLKDEVIIFIRMIGDLQELPSAEVMKKSLAANKVKKIRINYVTYRKVTVDEAVVDKNMLSSSPPRSGPPRPGPGVDDIDIELPNKSVFVDEAAPHSDMYNLVNLPVNETQRGLEFIAGQIKALYAQVKSGDAEKKFPTTEEMMNAVFKLRQEIVQGLETLKATGRVLAVPDSITEELDELSRETILRLIRDEYKNGTISVKRLAQIIRRIMPDVKELKKILPYLKVGLMSDGMSLSDYLQLVTSIVHELENDGLMDVLSSASNEMGVSVDEVVSGIKSDPEDAARLIILASEIRKGPGADTEQLSALLTDYVERVSQKMAVQMPSGTDEADSANKNAIRRFEDDLLSKLKSQGLQDAVVKQVKRRLTRNNRGYELPKGIFDIRATMFFLEHEIKLYLRYNAPFSTLMISCVSVKKNDGRMRPATPAEAAHISPAILTTAKKMLRDLDLIGVMGKISNDIPFIILPMTDEAGAQAVIARLYNAFAATSFDYDGQAVIPRVIVTSFEFDKSKTPDCASYLREAMALHKKRLDLDRSN